MQWQKSAKAPIATFSAALRPSKRIDKEDMQHSCMRSAFTQVTAHLNCLYTNFGGKGE